MGMGEITFTWSWVAFVVGCIAGPLALMLAIGAWLEFSEALDRHRERLRWEQVCTRCLRRRCDHRADDARCPKRIEYEIDPEQDWTRESARRA